jgi:hypothetical protein
MATTAPVDPVEQLLREYTSKMRDVIRHQLAADVTAAVLKAVAGATDLPAATGSEGDVPRRSVSQVSRSAGRNMKALRGDDPQLLQALLKKHGGNIAAVAKDLNKIPVQIRRWLKKYSIDANVFRRAPGATASPRVGIRKTFARVHGVDGRKNGTAPTNAMEADGKTARNGRTVPNGKPKGRRRRDPDVLVGENFNVVLAHLKANPGQRSEQIAKATKINTSDLRLVLKKLAADKKLKAAGVARGTTYTLVK